MTENEFILADRLGVIRSMNEKYDMNKNAYIAFSGGKDSTVVHHLIDEALPGNTIPRIYSNTGIELNEIVKYVKEMQKNDERIEIIKPLKNIKETLETYGYPFKSKQYSKVLATYHKHADEIDPYFEMIEKNPSLVDSYDFIHNLPPTVKWVIKEYYGKRERERPGCLSAISLTHCAINSPKISRLKYQMLVALK